MKNNEKSEILNKLKEKMKEKFGSVKNFYREKGYNAEGSHNRLKSFLNQFNKLNSIANELGLEIIMKEKDE